MAVRIVRKAPGSGMSRSEIVTVRLDPKLRYLAELAARKQRRTLSSFVEWAVERGLESVTAGEGSPSLWDEADALWDVDESDRFVKLALRHPDLLTHDELVLWKVIREHGYLWKGRHNQSGDWIWTPSEGSLMFDRLREQWENYKLVAAGDQAARNALPQVAKKEPVGKQGKFDDLDDDIPF